jgi:NADH pyrophosphatase NudC (nudix superfamily)
MSSLFEHSDAQPFHISVGAVLVNEEGKILAHHMSKDRLPAKNQYKIGGLDDAYILMRETIENGESLEQAVARGLKEEFGAEGDIKKYLGSLQFEVEGFEKTELFFLVSLTKQGERPADDAEAHTELVWATPDFLIEKMKGQGARTDRKDLDESKIIEAYLKYGRD